MYKKILVFLTFLAIVHGSSPMLELLRASRSPGYGTQHSQHHYSHPSYDYSQQHHPYHDRPYHHSGNDPFQYHHYSSHHEGYNHNAYPAVSVQIEPQTVVRLPSSNLDVKVEELVGQNFEPDFQTGFSTPPTVGTFTQNNNVKKNNSRAPNRPPGTVRISQQKCLEYIEQCPSFPPPEITVKVTYGHPALLGEFPPMAAIGWGRENGNGYIWSCAGSLISEQHVMTSAHCLSISNPQHATFDPSIVRLGELDFSRTDEGTMTQDIPITRVVIHPDFRSSSKYNDIALIELAKPAIMNRFVWPLCLWQNGSEPDPLNPGYAVSTGWKIPKNDEGATKALLAVDLYYVPREKCERDNGGPNREMKRGVIEKQICVANRYGGKGTCHEPNGGPLYIRNRQRRCIFHQIGIASAGIGCGTTKPGVYTRVGSYIDWIESIVWP